MQLFKEEQHLQNQDYFVGCLALDYLSRHQQFVKDYVPLPARIAIIQQDGSALN